MRDSDSIEFICDNNRHLICLPYSVEGLHVMAQCLNIHRCWFHNKKGMEHYDIPKKRVNEIMQLCRVVSNRELLIMIKNDNS